MPRNSNLKIVGLTVSITWIMLIALVFFMNGLRVLYGDWFARNALAITIVSGIIVFIGLITGAISLRALVGSGKGFFS